MGGGGCLRLLLFAGVIRQFVPGAFRGDQGELIESCDSDCLYSKWCARPLARQELTVFELKLNKRLKSRKFMVPIWCWFQVRTPNWRPISKSRLVAAHI